MWGSRLFDIDIELSFSEDITVFERPIRREVYATGAVELLLRGDALRPEELHGETTEREAICELQDGTMRRWYSR
jgi:hypothetical protein